MSVRLFSKRGGASRFQCRWPISGQGYDLVVCGLLATAGPYCEAHHQLAYRGVGVGSVAVRDPTILRVKNEDHETAEPAELVEMLGG